MFPEVRSSLGKRALRWHTCNRGNKGSVILNSVIFFSLTCSLSAADALRDGEILEAGMRGNDAVTLYRSHLALKSQWKIPAWCSRQLWASHLHLSSFRQENKQKLSLLGFNKEAVPVFYSKGDRTEIWKHEQWLQASSIKVNLWWRYLNNEVEKAFCLFATRN